MPRLKVLTVDAVSEIDAEFREGRAFTSAAGVSEALGWDLKTEGLCRGDVCVPIRDEAAVLDGDRVDLGGVADLLGMASLLDEEASALAVSAPSADRRAALKDRVAPDFELPDVDGNLHSLEEFKDRKRLLIAFASW